MDTELWCVHLCVFLHMANLHSYLTGFLLLLTWNWRITVALPVYDRGAIESGHCATLFKTLLRNVSGLLKNDVLWHAIRSEKMFLNSSSETVLACAPAMNETTRCLIQRSAPFNENECLKNIIKDLAHYEAVISSYIKQDLKSPDVEIPSFEGTLYIIRNLRESCSVTPAEKESLEDVSHLWVNDSFSNRQQMLMMMRAFHIRTITFNRAVGYIASGEHKKPNSSL